MSGTIRWSTLAENKTTGGADQDLYLNVLGTTNLRAIIEDSIVLNTGSTNEYGWMHYFATLYETKPAYSTVYANSAEYHAGDPLFVGGDDIETKYKLANGSVAIDGTGVTTTDPNNSANPIPNTDLAGETRPIGAAHDYGAFEYQGNRAYGLTHVYNGQAQALVAVDSTVTTVEYSTDGGQNWSSAVPTAKDAGEYTVQVRFTANRSGSETLTVTGRITPLQLVFGQSTPSTAADKTYDGNTSASVTPGQLTNKVGSDDVTVAVKTASFRDPDVGNNKPVDVTYEITGDDAGNYTAPAAETLRAAINPATIEDVSVSGWEGVYNAQTHSITVTDPVSTDTILYSTDGETYDLTANPVYTNVGTYTVYVKVSRANYNDWTGSAVVKIDSKALTLTFTPQEKFYDGDETVKSVSYAWDGLVNSENINLSVGSATFTSKDVGTRAIDTISYDYASDTDAAVASNYNISVVKGSAAIKAKQLTISGTSVASRDYDGTDAALITAGILSGICGSDNVGVTGSGAFSTADVNDAGVLVSYTLTGDDASNYTAPAAETVAASINKKALTLAFTAQNKTYDGGTTVTITGCTPSGLIEGETLTATATDAAFADKNAGSQKTVNINAYTTSGTAKVSNYAITVADVKADIEEKEIALNFTAADKTYDGSRDAVVSNAALDGVESGDEVSVTSTTGTFASANAGKWVVTPEFTLSGADKDNYTVIPAEVKANINPATITGVSINDATVPYTGQLTTILVTGDLPGDVVSYSADGEHYSRSAPGFAAVGEHPIYAKVERENYADWTGSAVLTITPGTISGLTFNDTIVAYDGSGHSIEVGGSLVSGDVVTYSTDGENYSDVVPAFTDVGEYTVYAKVERVNYDAWTGSAVLTITGEYPPTPPVPVESIVVNTAGEDDNPDDDVISLREALAMCAAGEGDYITFADGITTLSLNSGFELDSDYNGITIDGGGDVVLGGTGENNCVDFVIFTLDFVNEITFKGLTFQYIETDEYGTAISASGDPDVTLTVDSCRFLYNANEDYGGAIYVDCQNLVVQNNCEFIGNRSDEGGAIYVSGDRVDQGEVSISGTSFENNQSVSHGGAVYVTDVASLEVKERCYFANNEADVDSDYAYGGAIYFESYFVSGNEFNVHDSTFNYNKSIGGGGIHISGNNTSCEFKNIIFTNNSSAVEGGAIYVSGANLEVIQSLIADNKAAAQDDGGGIYVTGNSSVTVSWSTLANNTNSDIAVDSGSATVSNSIALDLADSVAKTGVVITNSEASAADLFTDAAHGDYTLKANSAAINASGVNPGDPETDLAGNPRGVGASYDCGAYEYQGASPASLPYRDAADAAFDSLDEDDLKVDFDVF